MCFNCLLLEEFVNEAGLFYLHTNKCTCDGLFPLCLFALIYNWHGGQGVNNFFLPSCLFVCVCESIFSLSLLHATALCLSQVLNKSTDIIFRLLAMQS